MASNGNLWEKACLYILSIVVETITLDKWHNSL